MGGDHGPSVTLPACQSFLAAHPEAELLLVGRAEALAPALGWARCTVVGATEVVEMDDSVEVALRRKRDSSMRVAIGQVKPDATGLAAAQASVSAGNTGALRAVSRYLLKTREGSDRYSASRSTCTSYVVLPNAIHPLARSSTRRSNVANGNG